MGDLDDEKRREGLPGQLSDWRYRANEGVLVALEVSSLLEAERGTITQDRFIEDLEAD